MRLLAGKPNQIQKMVSPEPIIINLSLIQKIAADLERVESESIEKETKTIKYSKSSCALRRKRSKASQSPKKRIKINLSVI